MLRRMYLCVLTLAASPGFPQASCKAASTPGLVGMPSEGYNIGGIVGQLVRISERLHQFRDDLGRKDVGGITGQLVPEVRLLYTESQVGDLLDELDVLRDLIGRTNDDARSASNEISERMQAISDRAGEVQGAISDLADLTTDWANENIDAVNSMSARISWLTDKLSPIMEDATDALDLMEKLAGQMNDVMDEAQEAGDLALDAADRFEDVMDDLRVAARHGRDSADHLKAAMAHLRNVLGNPDTDTTLAEIQAAVSELSKDLSDIDSCFVQIWEILQGADGVLQGRPEWAALLEKLGAFQSACAALPNCLDQVNDALAQVIGSETAAPEALAQLKSAAEDLLAAGQAFGQAGAELAKALMNVAPGQGPDLTAAYQKLQDASQQLTDTQEEVENILKDLGASEAERDLQMKLDELNAAIAAAELAAAEAEDALAALAGIESAQTVVETLQVELAAIRTSLERAKLSAQEIAAASGKIWWCLPSISRNWRPPDRKIQAARDSLSSALRAIGPQRGQRRECRPQTAGIAGEGRGCHR